MRRLPVAVGGLPVRLLPAGLRLVRLIAVLIVAASLAGRRRGLLQLLPSLLLTLVLIWLRVCSLRRNGRRRRGRGLFASRFVTLIVNSPKENRNDCDECNRGQEYLPARRRSLDGGLGRDHREISDRVVFERAHIDSLRQNRRSGGATPERLSQNDAVYFAPPCDRAGAGVAGAAGVIGFGEVEPEPVVLGDVGELVVAVGDEPLLAVLVLLFQPAMIRKPISSRTATPAIQPHIPPAALSSRRSTGSLNRGSLYRGSVKRGSVMTSSFIRTHPSE
jgi:hypothetical protein